MRGKGKVLAVAMVIALVGAELAARLSGATDFPIYQVDTDIG